LSIANRYWVGDTDTWNATAGSKWAATSGGAGGETVPASTDNVYFDANSGAGTVTIGSTVSCNHLDFTGSSIDTVSGTSPISIYGDLTVASGMTWGHTNFIYFYGSSSDATITTNGVEINSRFYVDKNGWSLIFADDFLSVRSFVVYNSILETGGYTMNTGQFEAVGTSTISYGNGQIRFSGSGTVWNLDSTVTLTGDGPIYIENGTATAKTFVGGGRTYYDLYILSDNVTITGSNSFDNLRVNIGGESNGLKLASGTTQTIRSEFSANGSAGYPVKLSSSVADSAAVLWKTSGTVVESYMTIKDSVAMGGADWYASNSTNVSGNFGWVFRDSIAPTAIGSTTVFGSPSVGTVIVPSGFSSTSIGVPAVLSDGIVVINGLASTTSFGTPVINIQVLPTGIASTVAFGTVRAAAYVASATEYSASSRPRTSYANSDKQTSTHTRSTKNKTSYVRGR